MQNQPEFGPEPKRQRLAATEHVFLSCFDEPDKLIEVDVSLISGCHMGALVRHQEPHVASDGKKFWKVSMTRAMLITVIRSLTLGELVVGKNVTISEALATFEYEGICLSKESNGHPLVAHPRQGVAFSKLIEPVADVLGRLCGQVADAIVSWPRLEVVLDAALGRQDSWMISSKFRGYGGSITASSNRIWVRFADRPRSVAGDASSFAAQLVAKNPRWLTEGLIALGIAHYRLASSLGPEFAKARNEEAFKHLYREVEADTLGSFFSVGTDFVKTACDARARKELNRGERFCNEMKQCIMASLDAEHEKPSVELQYAWATVTFVENALNSSPNCCKIFSSLCSDDNGATPERLALKKALKMRGVSVVRWMEERDVAIRPIVFPPNWRESTHSTCNGPSVLLAFDNLR